MDLDKRAADDDAEKPDTSAAADGDLAQTSLTDAIKAVVVMAENATPSKIEATRAYGAEVVLH